MINILWRKRLRLGDTVKLISGSEKGKISVIKAFTKTGVIIKDCHRRYRFVNKMDPETRKMQRVRVFAETSIDPSKIMLCDDNGFGGRISYVINEKGEKKRKIISTGKIL